MKHLEKRDLFGTPPRELPAGIWPATPTPPTAPRVEPPAAPRKPPVPVGAVASSVTRIRPIELHDENET